MLQKGLSRNRKIMLAETSWVPCKSQTVLFKNLEKKQLRSNTITKSKEHKQHSNKNLSFFAFKWHCTKSWTQGRILGFTGQLREDKGQEYQTEGLKQKPKKKLTANKITHQSNHHIYTHTYTQLLCYSTSHKHDARTKKMTTLCTSVKRLSPKNYSSQHPEKDISTVDLFISC